MRKAVIMLILLGAVSLPSAGRSFEELMESYGPNKGVVTVAMSESVLQRMAGRDDNDLLRKLSKLMIISVTAPEEDTLRNAFLADAELYASDGFEELYSVSTGGSGSRISVYLGADSGKALMLAEDDVSVLLMEMKGNIDGQMLDALLNNEIRIK
jgi:hypothetical protein